MDGAAVGKCCFGVVGTMSEWPWNYDPVVNNLPIINIFADVRLDGPSTDTGAGSADDLISANLVARTRADFIVAEMLLSSSGEVWPGTLGSGGGHGLEAPVELGRYHNLGLRLDFTEKESEFFLNGNSVGVLSLDPDLPERLSLVVTLELLALDDPATIDPGQYTAYFDNLIITVGDEFPPQLAPLQPGDADPDFDFDQLDLVRVQVAAKYLTGHAATWGEGDWNAAPGGRRGNPPPGDGLFNQVDIIAALTAGKYLSGPYAAVRPNGMRGDVQTSLIYNPTSGEIAVNAPAGKELSSINIDSAAGIFTGQAAQNLGGSFDNDADNNIFKATFGSSFGSLSFGNVAQPGLSEQFVHNDLSVVGSLAGGGALGDVDLVYVPEPSSILLLAVGLAAWLSWQRKRVLPFRVKNGLSGATN